MTSKPPTTGNVQVNDVIVSVSAMKTTPIRPPLLSPCDDAFNRKLGQAQLEQPQQAEPERHEEPGHEQVQPGIVGQRLQRRRREEEREEDPDGREDPDDRQAVNDRQPSRLVSSPFPCPCLTKKLTVIGPSARRRASPARTGRRVPRRSGRESILAAPSGRSRSERHWSTEARSQDCRGRPADRP